VLRIIGKSFATNYAGDMHERLDTSNELGFDAVNRWVWGLSDHLYIVTVPDEDVLKVIKRGRRPSASLP
jgi:hypothetical protein